MILINGKEHEWSKNLTVQKILDIKRYTFPKIIVKVNGKLISKDEYLTTLIYDGDEVQVIHLLAGG
ncbi:sulfur carrier protein ThiS [Proteiniborus sp. MB09-C3]|uniref:sulfur carrier protein ThiS n=1 Tax=Proteiniborus sp. MB09-C3 TaxID=3050072 RepID=UPI002553E9B9|nr:sulfur carrier protein ThiS [Proteiniborus sp. MB09-C3]WIV10932.1 sulfur carrier protein ThiS [Proteiniborus sp. MB09-C3]